MGVNIMSAKLWAFSLGARVGRHRGPDVRELPAVRQPRVVHVHGVGVRRLHRRHRRHGLDSGRDRRRAAHPGHAGDHPRLRGVGHHPGLSRRAGSAITNYRYLVFGLVMVIMMALRPQGIIPSKRRAAELQPDDDEIARRRERDALRRPARHRQVQRETTRARAGKGTDMAHLVDAQNVTMQFGGLKAVSDVTLHIDEGEIVALIGPNGAGKTTFFNMLTGIYTPTEGTLTFNGTSRRRHEAARDRAAGHRPHVPEHPPVPEHDGARERHGRPSHAHEGQRRSARCSARRVQGARRSKTVDDALEWLQVRRARRARPTSSRRTCPTATSAASRSRARWPPSPSCSCSTSRPPA